MRKLLLLSAVVTVISTVSSCGDTCSENKNALPLAGFYAAGGTAEKITPDSLEVKGVGADSVLSPATEAKNELYLPFRIDSDTTAFIFSQHTETYDRQSKVTFIYSRTPHFVDVDCGASYIFDIRKIECDGELIDSVTCPTGFIDNTNIENLKIYFAPNL